MYRHRLQTSETINQITPVDSTDLGHERITAGLTTQQLAIELAFVQSQQS